MLICKRQSNRGYRLFLLLTLLLFSGLSQARALLIPENSDVAGETEYVRPQDGETLAEVGIRYDVGYKEMLRANPQVNPTQPLSSQVRLLIPSQYILPQGSRQGLVINLAEYRLYYFPPGDNVVITMPVGIGREGWDTPLGLTKVVAKERDPVWRPSAKLQAEAAKRGNPVPNEFPAGSANPLGRHILRLGWPTYLIHGSNRRDAVGTRVSAGCIRLTPENMETLFEMVAVGTEVRVINKPVKQRL